jgi:hypothetical protein
MILTAPPNYCDGWIYDPKRRIYIAMAPTGSAERPCLVLHWPPASETIDEVLVQLDGHGGGLSHGALPASKPSMAVGKIYCGEATAFGTAQDSAGLESFNAAHDISVSLTSQQQSNVDSYWVEIWGGGGEGSQPGALSLDKVTIVYL